MGARGGHGALGLWDGRRAGVARPKAHGATWGLPGRVARGQRAGVLSGHGSSLTRTHALGPTEELAGAIEFVSGTCHRCHRYRNRQTATSRDSDLRSCDVSCLAKPVSPRRLNLVATKVKKFRQQLHTAVICIVDLAVVDARIHEGM